jgi:pyridoxine 4-dehydrogenase
MQLAGPGVMGPPADRDSALAVLREAAGLGITHIDTSNAYGPRVTSQLIRKALHPYPQSLHIVTKVGATRDPRPAGQVAGLGGPATAAGRRGLPGRTGRSC